MDTLNWIELANILVLALLLGGEVALILGTHPALMRLPAEMRSPAMRVVCKRYGLVLPILAVTAIATATATALGLMFVNRPFWFGLIGWLCLALTVAITFRFLRPVNTQLATFPDSGSGWSGIARTWQLWRVATAILDAIAFLMFAVALLKD